ncbi:helix-turn-helix transcriptional regulator [Kineococcus terrestris]|uniref:helix-turn-helix transcriptional regulator n=1 Tax=Kineococcus terrestris TaxID=2044856 RepID=UPI0034DACA27
MDGGPGPGGGGTARRARPVGREEQSALLAGHLADARRGRAGTVLVLGAAGAGKTLLLRELAATAGDFRTVRLSAAADETGSPHSALELLVRSLPARVAALPAPQRRALAVVTGREAGAPPDALLVGLAVEGLLSGAGPLLCLVDDADRLDPASLRALASAARRLREGRLLLVLAARPGRVEDAFGGSARVLLPPLDHVAAHRLLDALVEVPVEPHLREQLVAESRGDPAALCGFVDLVGPAALASGLGALAPAPPGTDLPAPAAPVRGLLERAGRLAPPARTALLAAAAEPTGDPASLRSALRVVGLRPDDLTAAADGGLVEVGARVLLADPRLRPHLHRGAAPAERRRVHAALALAAQRRDDPDRAAWHRALAAPGPDDGIARDLEERAGAAADRGAVGTAALLLERAAALTGSPADAADRQWRAGRAWQESGDAARARPAIAGAALRLRDAGRAARTGALMARMDYDQRHGRREVDRLVELVAADREPARADVEARLRAVVGTMISGSPSARDRLLTLATDPAREGPAGFAEAALDALLAAAADRPALAVTCAERAVASLPRAGDLSADVDFMWIHLVCVLSWDEAALVRLARRYVDEVRSRGRLAQAGLAYNYAAVIEMHAGRLGEAEELSRRARRVRELTGARENHRVDLLLAAWRGEGSRVADLARACRGLAAENGETRVLATVAYAQALLHNGSGRWSAAARALAPERRDTGFAPFLLPEEVEAAVRAGDLDRARRAHRRLQEWIAGVRTPWARGLDLRCRALLLDPAGGAEDLHREAVAVSAEGESSTQLARARLLLGEHLRRARRHVAARRELGPAHETFTAVGAAAFAARAARELRAAGGVPRGAGEGAVRLTAQQVAVARLAAGGATSKDIAATLVVSPRTVHAHLRAVFATLDVTSRRALGDALAEHGIAGEDVDRA